MPLETGIDYLGVKEPILCPVKIPTVWKSQGSLNHLLLFSQPNESLSLPIFFLLSVI